MPAPDNYILVNFAADDTDTIRYEGNGLTIYCTDDFGSGSITIDSSPDGTQWVSEVTAQTAAFNWSVGSAVAAGMNIRVTLSSSTSPDLNVHYFKGI
jgi:hypothetical protein